MKIHKQFKFQTDGWQMFSHWLEDEIPVCRVLYGIRYHNAHTVSKWSKVNCKNCLKKKRKTK